MRIPFDCGEHEPDNTDRPNESGEDDEYVEICNCEIVNSRMALVEISKKNC